MEKKFGGVHFIEDGNRCYFVVTPKDVYESNPPIVVAQSVKNGKLFLTLWLG